MVSKQEVTRLLTRVLTSLREARSSTGREETIACDVDRQHHNVDR
jgi:hypothetical protein